jgi:hypothetical protein
VHSSNVEQDFAPKEVDSAEQDHAFVRLGSLEQIATILIVGQEDTIVMRLVVNAKAVAFVFVKEVGKVQLVTSHLNKRYLFLFDIYDRSVSGTERISRIRFGGYYNSKTSNSLV